MRPASISGCRSALSGRKAKRGTYQRSAGLGDQGWIILGQVAQLFPVGGVGGCLVRNEKHQVFDTLNNHVFPVVFRRLVQKTTRRNTFSKV